MAPTNNPEIARPTTPLDLEMAAADRLESLREKTRTVGGVTFPAHPFVETLQHDVFQSSVESIKLWLNPQRADIFQMGYWDANTPPVYLPSISTKGATAVIEKRSRPRWDTIGRTLYFGTDIVKRFKQPSKNQITILADFQKRDWPRILQRPLPLPKEELSSAVNYSPSKDPIYKRLMRVTVADLNKNHKTPRRIRFRMDHTGLGVLWERCRI